MYGECNDENVCNETAHYDCQYCGENLCAWHIVFHWIKRKILKRCYLWRHQN